MPDFRLGHRSASIALLVGGAIVLIGGQQIAPTASVIAPGGATTESFAMSPLQPQPVALYMPAAKQSGQFEDVVQPTVQPTPVPTVAPTVAPTPEPKPEPEVYESGIASTYGEGDGFEGNRTACGQVFHTAVPQIAHKSLPCGTTVKVEDTDTGRVVVAQVTDRGPYVAGRIVDLSWGAFEQLESSPGLLHVNVYVMDDEN